MVGPAVEQLSQTMSDKIKIAKLNVDENQEIAVRYGVQFDSFFITFQSWKRNRKNRRCTSKRSISKIR